MSTAKKSDDTLMVEIKQIISDAVERIKELEGPDQDVHKLDRLLDTVHEQPTSGVAAQYRVDDLEATTEVLRVLVYHLTETVDLVTKAQLRLDTRLRIVEKQVLAWLHLEDSRKSDRG